MERRWIGGGCVELRVGRTPMVRVYALLKFTTVAGQAGEHGLKIAPGVSQQGHVISMLHVSDKGLQLKYHVVPDKLSIMAVCNTHIFVLCPMAVKRYLDDGIKIKIEECWGQGCNPVALLSICMLRENNWSAQPRPLRKLHWLSCRNSSEVGLRWLRMAFAKTLLGVLSKAIPR